MIRLPTRSTRTHTLFPYTSLFRSELAVVVANLSEPLQLLQNFRCDRSVGFRLLNKPSSRKSHPFLKRWQTKAQRFAVTLDVRYQRGLVPLGEMMVFRHKLAELVDRVGHPIDRTEERRVGKAWVSTCRSRGSRC